MRDSVEPACLQPAAIAVGLSVLLASLARRPNESFVEPMQRLNDAIGNAVHEGTATNEINNNHCYPPRTTSNSLLHAATHPRRRTPAAARVTGSSAGGAPRLHGYSYPFDAKGLLRPAIHDETRFCVSITRNYPHCAVMSQMGGVHCFNWFLQQTASLLPLARYAPGRLHEPRV